MLLKHRHFPGLFALMVLSLIIFTTQCVEEYKPNIPTEDNLLVVNGSIIQGNEQQTIILTKSTSISNPGFNPVRNCKVFITDDKNNTFRFEEIIAGTYIAEINSSYLEIGAKYKLTIETPNDQVYESTFEEIYDSPPIDSLYFINETIYSEKLSGNVDGIRLNVDIYANEEYEGYYRWKIHEDWEFRTSNNRIEKMLIGVLDEFITTYKYDTLTSEYVLDRAIPLPEFIAFNEPDTFSICYLDSEVDGEYFSGTSQIVTNSRKRVPLHFTPYNSKISTRYSCLVSQYTLSEGAYNYWQTKVTEIQESGGMYNTQPSQNLSNIKNINNEEETVLGYFWVSAFKQKRVFFKGPYMGRVGYCASDPFNIEDFYEQVPDGDFGEFRRIDSMYFPVYVTNDFTSPPTCFDCRYTGGTLIRPEFW